MEIHLLSSAFMRENNLNWIQNFCKMRSLFFFFCPISCKCGSVCAILVKHPNWKYFNNWHLLHLPLPGYMVVNSSASRAFSGAHFDDANLLQFWPKSAMWKETRCRVMEVELSSSSRPSNRKQPNSHKNVYQTAPAGSQQINRNEMHWLGWRQWKLIPESAVHWREREREMKRDGRSCREKSDVDGY